MKMRIRIQNLEQFISFISIFHLMFLALNTLQRQIIPSFQSIDFKLSQNFTSRNPSISLDNDYEPQSLTYTQTEIGDRLSLKFLDLPEHDKQNHNHIQIAQVHPHLQPFPLFKHQQSPHPEKYTKMKKKKSILVINNIQLNCDDTTDRSQEDTKRSNAVNFKRMQRKSSFIKTRPNSASTSTHCSPQLNKISESILLHNNNSNLVQNTDTGSEIKKKSISCMKTQDRSIIESVSRSCSKPSLQRSNSERTSCYREQKKKIVANVQGRYSRRNSTDRVSMENIQIKGIEVNQRRREARRNFLQDGVSLENMMNVKSIKLQQNIDVSRAYLRKIIQNRVSMQHYVQSEKKSRRIRQ